MNAGTIERLFQRLSLDDDARVFVAGGAQTIDDAAFFGMQEAEFETLRKKLTWAAQMPRSGNAKDATGSNGVDEVTRAFSRLSVEAEGLHRLYKEGKSALLLTVLAVGCHHTRLVLYALRFETRLLFLCTCS